MAHRRKSLVATVALLAVASLALPAEASPRVVEQRVAVRIDPDASPAQTYRRLERAASLACRTDAVRPYDRVRFERACRDEFMTEAIAKLGDARLAEIRSRKQTGVRAPA